MTSAESSTAISVIVPVFNVGAWIEEGLQSLLQQDISQSYEVILVDDCSTDNSREICREYAARHRDKFRLIENPANSGVSHARNLGLEQARGEYIMFFDPDDLLPASALGDLYRAAREYAADIVKGNLVLFNADGRKPAPDRVDHMQLLRGEAVLTTLYEHRRVRGHVGGKLYRRDKFGALRFPAGVRMAEDLLFFSEMFAQADSLLLSEREVYCYRKHSTGTSAGKYQKGSHIDWLDAIERSGRFARSEGQRRAHRGLLLRTLTQIVRECRGLDAAAAASVLTAIEQKCDHWNIRLPDLLLRDRISPRDLGRYLRFRLTLAQIRRNLGRV